MNACTKTLLIAGLPALILSLAMCPSALAGTTTSGDFNGDGFADLAIGVPDEAIGAIAGAGAVAVIYGSGAGLHDTTPVANQFWHQDKGGIEDLCEGSDNFGSAVASGDFDGDGFADLAIGIPGENTATGAVSVIYGSASGLAAAGDQYWDQNSTNVAGANQAAQLFGSALAVGDFNNDGRDNLAIGVPGESESGLVFAGAVVVMYGTGNGLNGTNSQLWDQTSLGEDSNEMLDGFGTAVAAGDFNNDGFDDLSVGSPAEGVGAVSKAGMVHIVLGSAARLTATGGQAWSQDSASVLDQCEADDAFGTSLAAGDFDGDGFADLAVGVPAESVGGGANAGAIHVFYGVAGGVDASRDQFWNQDSANILEQVDTTEAGEGFGTSLAAGFFNDDSFCDLAIGAPNEDFLVTEVGVTHVLYGRSTGLKVTNNQVWSQDSGSIGDTSEEGDHLGFALSAGDFNGDGRVDLAMGVPGESIGVNSNCGSVTVIYGGATKFAGSGSQLWHQNRPNILDKCEAQDGFGASVAP